MSGRGMASLWRQVGTRFLPFADAASETLPLGRLVRLSLFQVSVGMATVLLTGTLNRVMIVELDIPASVVAFMVALPIVFAPVRALVGHRSDTYRSILGWRRVPFIWMGTMLQFGGLALMPFALLVLTGRGELTVPYAGEAGAAVAFLLVGAGLHTTQTAGLALACDMAREDARPRVVALLYFMLLVGMLLSALVFSVVLADFSHTRLIQVVQGAALVTLLLNMVALWKQEGRNPARTAPDRPRPAFHEAWEVFAASPRTRRMLLAVALGTAAFSMQDILLEPYGGQVLRLSVGATTMQTALMAAGTIAGLALAARALSAGTDPVRLAAYGALSGLPAFSFVIFSAPLESVSLFRLGAVLIGFGGGLFSVGMLSAVMDLARNSESGIALGAWGAVQATATGLAVGTGGAVRDLVQSLVARGDLGAVFAHRDAPYGVVYHIEIALLFATLVALGPLVRYAAATDRPRPFGLAELPG
ncbi:BCD family MFS transporter [Aureimonas leprariae]|uniref:BCD family MFS transporter n=1 Tax=Plantimonas leprariae TaxID=2615207 RepID=A0A7V7PQ97_9HYPH|nr:BCD family MFS transporter [Aureimonas leprariae]KAB0680333.1 BCD family MFS transporter [Aureimonas leprariae]